MTAESKRQFSDTIKQVALVIQSHEGYVPAGKYAYDPLGSPAYRNKNPGNIIWSELARSYGAVSFWTHPRTRHDFAIFPTYEDGFDCLCQLIETTFTTKTVNYYPEMTILQYFSKYSPVRENGVVVPNYSYAEDVAQKLGVTIYTRVKDLLNTDPTKMSYYSQHTPGYNDRKNPAMFLGTCADTLWQSACFLTSFCNLGKELEWFDYNPVTMNKLFITNKLFANGCMLVCQTVAKHFGLTYEKFTSDPGVICIAETNKYAPKVPQHFFVYEKGMIIDPLDPPETIKWKPNTYPLVSFRVFKKPKVQETQTPEPVTEAPVIPDAPKMQETAQGESNTTASTNVPATPPNTPETDQETGLVEPVAQRVNWTAIWQAIINLIKRLRS